MSEVIIEKGDGYAVIFMSNKNKRNALDSELSKALISKAVDISKDDDIRAVVLAGTDHIFCSGADLNEFSAALEKNALGHYKNMETDVKVFDIVKIINKPVIAAVEGYALGGGFGLACSAHIVVSSPSCRFGMPELSLGIFPYVIFPYVKNAIGARNAVTLALTRKIIDANEAKRIGVVYEIADDPIEKAKAIAKSIASLSPTVLQLSMNAINDLSEEKIDSKYLALLRIINFAAEDLKIGTSAFKKKIKPEWRGK